MRFDRQTEFITEQERGSLVQWFDQNLDNSEIFKKGFSRGVWGYELRRTTRANKSFEYPELVTTIFNRITKLYNLDHCPKQNVCVGGVIAVVTFPGGDTYLHTDPKAQGGLEAVTFNILIQAPDEGGLLYIGPDLEEKKLNERELHCYMASKHQHKISKTVGNTNRYMLIFRLAMIEKDWEQGE